MSGQINLLSCYGSQVEELGNLSTINITEDLKRLD